MKPEGVKISDWYYYNALFMMEHLLGYQRFQRYFGSSQKQLFNKINGYLTDVNCGKVYEVESMDKNISYEDFMRLCYQPLLPKIFRGAASEWEAVKKWNLNFFETYYGQKEIILNDNIGMVTQQGYERMNLKYYIQQIKEGSLKYLRFSDIVNQDKNLKSNFDLAWLRKFNLPLSWGEDLLMFMGGKDTITPLHVGFSGFLFVQVMGEKKWTLYPPSDRLFLDPRTERTFYFYSNANPYQQNDPAYPLLKYAKRYEVTLKPGDVLWVPSFTWHYVENFTDSIGIRYGRGSIGGAAKSSRVLTALIFMATRPTMIEHYYFSMRKNATLSSPRASLKWNARYLIKSILLRKYKSKNRMIEKTNTKCSQLFERYYFDFSLH